MDKKGISTGVIVSVIIGIIVVIAFVFLLIIVSQDSNKKEENQTNVSSLNLYVNSVDSDTKQQINANYIVLTEMGQVLSQGELNKDSLTEVKNIPKSQKAVIYCYSEGYYSSKSLKEFSQVEKDNNASKFTCNQDQIGNLKVTHLGDMNSIDNIIRFNISTDKHFKGLSAVVSWAGIINVDFKNNVIQCDTPWLNYSYYDVESKLYNYLPENHYLCGNVIQVCSSITGNTCTLKEEIPPRYNRMVDKAISTGQDLNKDVYQLILYVKTEEVKTQGDYLEIRFYDNDLIYNGQFIQANENGGSNVGSPDDFVYRILYEQ